MQNHIQKTLNFIVDHSFAMIGISTLIVLYAYEITFGTVLFYIFALIGFILTTGLMVIAVAGLLTKDTIGENEKLKLKLKKSQESAIQAQESLVQACEELEKLYQHVDDLKKSQKTMEENTENFWRCWAKEEMENFVLEQLVQEQLDKKPVAQEQVAQEQVTQEQRRIYLDD